jgi:hypothetical protein
MTAYQITASDASGIIEARFANDHETCVRVMRAMRSEYPANEVSVITMPEKGTMSPTIAHADEPQEPVVILDPTKPRRIRVCRVEIPPEVHALAALTNREPAEIINDLISERVQAMRYKVAALLQCEVQK